jgi:agmatine deiminase
MKKAMALLLALLFTTIAPRLMADSQPQEDFLPIGLTDEEMQRLDEIGKYHLTTSPPTGVIRNPAEWEPSEGVIIRWPLGLSIALIAEMSEDVVVTTIVGSASEENSAHAAYASGGVNMENVQFIIAPTNSIWTRDYGPWFIFADGQQAIVDHIYNRPRPYDDLIPKVIGSEWGLPVYAMNLVHTGGNHMSDGLGMSMSTRLVYDENPGKTPAQVDSIMLAYVGNDYTVLDYIESGGIHHIDCWAKFLNPTTILIKDVSPSDPSYALLNARAAYLSQQISAWGQPYTIMRIYCPGGTAYTNSLILNKKVFVPLFGSSYDATALQVYEEAMPGYEVLGFTGSWEYNDAIHCRAMGVPDKWMLFIHHAPLIGRQSDTVNEYPISATIIAYSGGMLVADSLKIYYRVDNNPWQYSLLNATPQPDSFQGYITAQPAGSHISYYLKAADLWGHNETHPYIGEPGAHAFVINIPPQITSPDSFICRADNSFGYCPEHTDADDTAHTISYSDYPDWLSVQNDSLVGTAPEERVLTGFSVVVADGYSSDSQHVTLLVYICGDLNDDSLGPNVVDVTYLVDYLFRSGTEPPVMEAADVDGDEGVNISDLTNLVNYLFRSGPAPVCDSVALSN